MGLYEFNKDDAYRFASEQGIKTKVSNGNLHFQYCPYCLSGKHGREDRWTFGIDLSTGKFFCQRSSCGAKGNMITLHNDFGFSLGNDVDNYYDHDLRKFRQIHMKKPESKDPAIKYMASRGISEAVTREYGITVQKDRENILVFPFMDENGNIQFVKYRKTDFQKGKDNNKEWCEANCKPILFGMFQCDMNNKTLVLTEGQCFDGAAEILTPDGWIRLENYGGQEVLQVNNDLTGSFVRPKQYIVKRHIGKMVHVSVGGNYESYTTDDHNIVYQNAKGELVKAPAIDHVSSAWHIPTAITIDSKEMSNWTNNMFALYLAISADGTIDYRKNTGPRKAKTDRYVRIAIALKRKYLRLVRILNNLGIQFSYSIDSRGYHSVCFPCPNWLESKYLPYDFATKTSLDQKRFIIAEMIEWDGNRVKGRAQYEYTTILKHNADVMQLIASSCGYMSTVRLKENGGNGSFKKGYCYKVNILLEKHNVSTQQIEKHKVVSEVDQRVYCVTVDSGMILVRQNGKISVSGNCDSLAVRESGIENAVSVPTGAKGFTWVPYCWDWLQKFDTLIVFGDHENGHITLLEEMKSRFHGQVKHVREEDYKGCKDANELLTTYGRGAVKNAVERAVPVDIEGVIDITEVKRVNISNLEKISSGIATLDKLLGGFYLGQTILLTGERGEGKSTLASQFATKSIEQGYNVFFYSGELISWYFRSWTDRQIAGNNFINTKETQFGSMFSIDDSVMPLIENWYRGRLKIYNNEIIFKDEHEDLLETVKKAITQYACKIIFLDNLMTAIEDDGKTDLYRQQSNFVKQLVTIGKTYNVLIFLIAHPRKSNGFEFSNDSVSGSSNITNLADVVLSYGSPKEDKNNPVDYPRELKVLKNRLTGRTTKKTGNIPLYFQESSKRISENGNFDWKLGWEPVDNNGFVVPTNVDIDVPFD